MLSGECIFDAPFFVKTGPILEKCFDFHNFIVSPFIHSTKEKALEYVKDNNYNYEYIPMKYRDDEEFVLEAFNIRTGFFRYISNRLKHDKEFLMKLFEIDSNIYAYFPRELLNDAEFMTRYILRFYEKYPNRRLTYPHKFPLECQNLLRDIGHIN